MPESQPDFDQVLPPEQIKTADFLKTEIFPKLPEEHFFLVGGTAIALHYGHRQSIDFDFFSFPKENKPDSQVEAVDRLFRNYNLYHRENIPIQYGQQHYLIKGVGITFMGFQNSQAESELELYKLPVFPTEKIFGFDTLSIRDLGALKAFARCQRSKMKDVVDLAEMLRHGVSLQDIITTAEKIFKYDFHPKEFLTACMDLEDIFDNNAIDEPIMFLNGKETDFYIDYLKSAIRKYYDRTS
ncbi:hypothetical protein MTBBW1_2360024 [Desulfamplus magnetovallimortis]|uniref:Nucleotidyl transferase AbiEii/AbiGii toxin family protein n=1 Tax=Desulfamplus magnetovallimortis TaxID=1246637 RepID=A0A1W1HDR5_9BACT|nr:nucleotidyl transferase AbiEii/AbiGii toxin family protein [Desulfamplus magnetovallimortis]SLM30641.1 hypothetical protein MTBBW1_2360024 [Desulfamplus magnetovallimortis]